MFAWRCRGRPPLFPRRLHHSPTGARPPWPPPPILRPRPPAVRSICVSYRAVFPTEPAAHRVMNLRRTVRVIFGRSGPPPVMPAAARPLRARRVYYRRTRAAPRATASFASRGAARRADLPNPPIHTILLPDPRRRQSANFPKLRRRALP